MILWYSRCGHRCARHFFKVQEGSIFLVLRISSAFILQDVFFSKFVNILQSSGSKTQILQARPPV